MGFDSNMRLPIGCVSALFITIACFGNAAGQAALSPTDTSVREKSSIELICTTANFGDNIQFTLNTNVKGTCLASLPCSSPTGPYTLRQTGTTQTIFTIQFFNCTSDVGEWTCSYGSSFSTITKLTCDNSNESGGCSWCCISDNCVVCILLLILLAIYSIHIGILVVICCYCNEESCCYPTDDMEGNCCKNKCTFRWPAEEKFELKHCCVYIPLVIAWWIIPGLAIFSLCYCWSKGCCHGKWKDLCGDNCTYSCNSEENTTSLALTDKPDTYVKEALDKMMTKFSVEFNSLSNQQLKNIENATKRMVMDMLDLFTDIDENAQITNEAVKKLSKIRREILLKSLCHTTSVMLENLPDEKQKVNVLAHCLKFNLSFVDNTRISVNSNAERIIEENLKKSSKLENIVRGMMSIGLSNQLFYQNTEIKIFILELEDDFLFDFVTAVHSDIPRRMTVAVKVSAFQNVLKAKDGIKKLPLLVSAVLLRKGKNI